MKCESCHSELDLIGQCPRYWVRSCDNPECPRFDRLLVSRNEQFDALVEGAKVSHSHRCRVADALAAMVIGLVVLAGVMAYLIFK
jgi:hypothetical protein